MKPNWDETKSCLLLSMRHLGDSVILSGFVNALKEKNPAMVVDILGRSELEEVTRRFSSIGEYLSFEIPFYGYHRRNTSTILHAIHQVRQLRRRRYDVCINIIGDIRENFVSCLSGAQVTIAPVWTEAHSFKRHIRVSSLVSFVNHKVMIPEQITGFYDCMSYFAQQLDIPPLRWPRDRTSKEPVKNPVVVAIHPGASHPSKQWELENWRGLVRELRTQKYRLLLFGTASQEKRLRQEFQNEIANYGLECITGTLDEFVSSLASVDILVGVDSFSVHTAHALGIPAVVLHGPFDWRVMTPPGCIPLSAGKLCPNYPCHDGKSCANLENKYICVRGIDVQAVLDNVNALAAQKRLEAVLS